MRKNAFTLIELLAVIVILAIIALIATPIILGIIKDSKEESKKRSIENYAKAIQNAIATNQLDGSVGSIGNFKTATLEDKLIIKYEGQKVECDTIELYKDGNIYLTDCKVNEESVEYTYGKDQSYDDGQIVYYDVIKGKGCTEEEYKSSYDEILDDYLNSQVAYNGIKEENDTSNKNSCLKFYAFNDDLSSSILNLLLDHNTTAQTMWYDITSINKYGPKNVLKSLYADTKGWNTLVIAKNYFVDQSTQTSGAKYEIKYNEIPSYNGASIPFKARLITAQEIAQITKADIRINWNENSQNSNNYYFHDLSNSSYAGHGSKCDNVECKYGWLYDRTSYDCEEYGCLNNSNSSYGFGYLTATSSAYDDGLAWTVDRRGYMAAFGANNHTNGVRPVIEVLKETLLDKN